MSRSSKNVRRVILSFALLTLCVMARPLQDAAAQSASELLERAMAAQAERLANVDDVTLTQSVMGMEVTVYMETRDVNGTPTLVPVLTKVGGMTNKVPQDQATADWSNPFQKAWVDRIRLEDDDEVDGHPVKVLVMDDFSGLEMPGFPNQTAEVQDFQPKLVRIYLDPDAMLIRKVDMTAEVHQADGTAMPMDMTMFMEDYRTVDGYVHPFRMRTQMTGVMSAAGVDQQEVAAQLEELRNQLANMPESQRAMMESMLKPQMEQLEAMMGSGGDAMETTVTVTDLKVNAGPPGGGHRQ